MDSHVNCVGNASVTVLGNIHSAKANATGRAGVKWNRIPRTYGVPSGLKNISKRIAPLI